MKHSIKRQMMVVFIALLIFMFGAIMACNIWLLEPYYIGEKEEQFTDMYEALVDTEALYGFENVNEENYNQLVRLAERENLFFFVLDMETRGVYTNVGDPKVLERNLDAFLLNKNDNEEILEVKDGYELSKSRDFTGTEYLMMRGELPGGYFFLIQSPLESIHASVALTNHFLLVVGGIVIVICMILVWFFSKRLTGPLQELAGLSEKMAELDFDAKYTSGGDNEIGVLGENFNRMSEKLEESISGLKTANHKLQSDIERREKMEQMRTEFLGNVSHELKTPIALIQGYAEGLKDNIIDDPESREYYLDVILDEADKMNHMVKNLLTLNQIEFGDETIEFQRLNLTELVQGVIHSMELFAEQTKATIKFRAEGPVYVWAEEFRVEQVIRNYLSNAFHHVSGECVIEVKIETEGDKAKVTVFNTGKPIPEKDLSHIWEKFYKVDKAHTRAYGGNGIGLSIVKAIMESLHQEYGVVNYDNGVAFWFELGLK